MSKTDSTTNKNMSRLLTRNWISNQTLPNKESPGPDWLHWKSLSNFKEGLVPILLKFFRNKHTDRQKNKQTNKSNWREGNISKLILRNRPNLDKATKENYRPISMMNTDAKVLSKIPNWFQQHIKTIIYNNQIGLIPGIQEWVKRQTSINVNTTLTKWSIKLYDQLNWYRKKNHLTKCTHFHDKNSQ